MLTKNEREWLEHRDAMQFLTGTYIADFAEFPLWNNSKDWQDAAEFSERVAAKLADWLARDIGCFVCGEKICKLKQKDRSCREKLLQAARLAVEEEIDGERQN